MPIDTVVWSTFPTTFKPVYEKNKEKKKKHDEKAAEKEKKKASTSPAKKKEKDKDKTSDSKSLKKELSATVPPDALGSPAAINLTAINRSSTIKNTDLGSNPDMPEPAALEKTKSAAPVL